jgi:hypothetical protein
LTAGHWACIFTSFIEVHRNKTVLSDTDASLYFMNGIDEHASAYSLYLIGLYRPGVRRLPFDRDETRFLTTGTEELDRLEPL